MRPCMRMRWLSWCSSTVATGPRPMDTSVSMAARLVKHTVSRMRMAAYSSDLGGPSCGATTAADASATGAAPAGEAIKTGCVGKGDRARSRARTERLEPGQRKDWSRSVWEQGVAGITLMGVRRECWAAG